MRALVTLSIVVLAATALAGCLGATSSGDDGPAPEPVPSSPSWVYRSSVDEDTRSMLDRGELAPGVPIPTGIARHTGEPSFEPTIGVTEDGNLFLSSFKYGNLGDAGVTGYGDYTSVRRSMDQGLTWEDVTPEIGPVSSPPNSNDPYVHVDPATDRVYALDMQGLACNWISFSDDEGTSWTSNPLGCGQPPLLDHPTLFSGPPRTAADQAAVEAGPYSQVVYLCVNRVADSACAKSLDGGITFTPFRTVFPGVDPEHVEPDPTKPTGTVFSGFCGGLHAHGTTGPDGTVYLPKGHCGVPAVAISEDDGRTWTRVQITEDVEVKGHEVAFAVDDEGNAYASWIGKDRKPHLAASPDGGRTWNDPVAVAPPSVGTADFPTITAGADGRIAMAYIGTGADVPYAHMGHSDRWNAYLTVATDALEDDPVLATTQVNEPGDPIARNECGNSRCWGDKGGALGDFIDVVIDDDGRPWAAFVDACTKACAEEDGVANDVGIGFVGTLRQGPRLDGPLQALPPLASLDR